MEIGNEIYVEYGLVWICVIKTQPLRFIRAHLLRGKTLLFSHNYYLLFSWIFFPSFSMDVSSAEGCFSFHSSVFFFFWKRFFSSFQRLFRWSFSTKHFSFHYLKQPFPVKLTPQIEFIFKLKWLTQAFHTIISFSSSAFFSVFFLFLEKTGFSLNQ